MNIFVLDLDPELAAQMHCDKHVPKLCVEATQMLVSAARRHGATDNQVPLTKSGTPHKGGYPNHPCTIWSGDSRDNFMWLFWHGLALCEEFSYRFGKQHACYDQIRICGCNCLRFLPIGKRTSFAQAMPDEYRNDDPVVAYRDYYFYDKRENIQCEWNKGRQAPDWWNSMLNRVCLTT
jgi:hypothetical protein